MVALRYAPVRALSPELHGELKDRGWCLMHLESDAALLALAKGLGDPVSARARGPVLQELTPLNSRDAAPNSLSARHGLGEFPLHTDAAHHPVPPRWMLLRCDDPGSAGRSTLLTDVRDFDLSLPERKDIARSVWRVDNGHRTFLASVSLGRDHGAEGLLDRLRFDPGCMSVADPQFEPAAEMLRSAISDLSKVAVDWKSGLTVIVDNWRILHGRAIGHGGDAGERRLKRVLVRTGATT